MHTLMGSCFAENANEQFLRNAAGNGDYDTVQRLLSMGVDPNACVVGFPESNALMCAIYRNDLPIVKLLINSGASFNRLMGRSTPLVKACQSGSPQMVECLLSLGADT